MCYALYDQLCALYEIQPKMKNFTVDQILIDQFLRDNHQNHYFSLKEQYDNKDIYSSGRWDLKGNFLDSTSVSLKDLHINESFSTETSLFNIITIDIILAGGVDTHFEHLKIVNNDIPRILFSSHARDGYQKRLHHAGEHYKAVGLWIKPNVLVDNFGLDLHLFPKLIAELLQVKYNRSLLLPITSRIRHCAEEILETQNTSKLKDKFIEARLTELLCHLLECLYEPEQSFNLSNHLSTRKSNAMKTVLARLNENTVEDIKLDMLAKEVGLSTTHLSKTFKSSYGMSISQYKLQQRLMRSYELVLEGKLSIYQVAAEVGYKDQSSFTRAFKGYFGFLPTHMGSGF